MVMKSLNKIWTFRRVLLILQSVYLKVSKVLPSIFLAIRALASTDLLARTHKSSPGNWDDDCSMFDLC